MDPTSIAPLKPKFVWARQAWTSVEFELARAAKRLYARWKARKRSVAQATRFLACVRAYLDAAAPFLVRAFARLIAGAPHDLNRVIEDARAALAPIVDSEL